MHEGRRHSEGTSIGRLWWRCRWVDEIVGFSPVMAAITWSIFSKHNGKQSSPKQKSIDRRWLQFFCTTHLMWLSPACGLIYTFKYDFLTADYDCLTNSLSQIWILDRSRFALRKCSHSFRPISVCIRAFTSDIVTFRFDVMNWNPF